MSHPQRNDPCPCGSGLKYKKCCLPIEEARGDEVQDGMGLLARAYKSMGDEEWEDAISLFKEALEFSSRKRSILEAIAACYDGNEDYLMTCEYYEKALACSPATGRHELYVRLGLAAACAGRLDKAEEAFRASAGRGPDDRAKKLSDKFLEDLQRVREGKKSPDSFRIEDQLTRAFSAMDDERYEEAATRLEKVAVADPENFEIFYNLGVVYTFLKDENKALEHFQRCVSLEPGYAPAYYNMGQINLLRRKDFSQALNFFDMAVAAFPDYIGAHHQRGIAYELLGDPLKALECWENTLKLDPANSQAKDNIRRVRESMSKQGTGEMIERGTA